MLRKISQFFHYPALKLARASSSFSQRSHTISELLKTSHGEEVSLSGWIHSIRFSGKFFLLRDSSGLIQIVVPNNLRQDLPSLESVVRVNGIVQHRPENQENKDMTTGTIEILADEVEILNSCQSELPIYGKDMQEASEMTRNRYRYLDLRRPAMTNILQLRSRLILAMRRFLCEYHGFVDVETPTLFRRTPGGAREFVVPTHIKDKFYSLVQSPQQFKQLLMVGGIDRYMQIARCYRDEAHRSDRQPEFTQLDIEMSFVSRNDVCQLIEDLLMGVWPVLPHDIPKLTPSAPFPRLSYQEALSNFGSDKPDLRFDLYLRHVIQPGEGISQANHSACAIVIPSNLYSKATKTKWKNLERDFKAFSSDGELKLRFMFPRPTSAYEIGMREMVFAEEEDLVLFANGDTEEGRCNFMGGVRLKVAEFLFSMGVPIYRPGFHFVWIEDFPLFTEEKGVLTSTHHPFTAPVPEDADLVFTSPHLVRGQHYDLVCNGVEVGGGSIRIHDATLQKYVLDDILKEDHRQLSHLLEALDQGCPPHGGIALGLDRLIALITQKPSIREVIAFPKMSEGRDLMSGSPAEIDNETKQYYFLK